MKLASLRIVTRDVPALTAFYEKITGIAAVAPFGGSDYTEVHTQGSILALVSLGGVEQYNADAVSAAANRSTIVEFEVDDVDAERSRLQAAVTDWVQEPTSQPWGNRSMLFRDPDGNLINFYTPAAPPRPPS